MPVGGQPPQPSDTIVHGYALNPRLRARAPRAQEQLLEEMLDEKLVRMLTKDAAPVAFVVPEGCDAGDFYLGAVEVNPDHGNSIELDLVVTVGSIKLSPNAQPGNGPLHPGDQITVTVPWRYGSWVELAPDHLRVPIVARFYAIQNS
jgi:hypothetical protein